MGFVGYVCRLLFDQENENHVEVLTHEHGMCEMHYRVGDDRDDMSVEDIEDEIGGMEIDIG